MKASLTQLCVYQTWHDFDQAAWKRCRDTAVAAQVSSLRGVKLLGNDIHEGALSLCKRDAQTAGVLHLLDLSCNDCRDYQPSAVPSLVVTNPPWGSRLTDSGWVFASTPDVWIQCAVICRLQSCEHFQAGVHQRGVYHQLFRLDGARWNAFHTIYLQHLHWPLIMALGEVLRTLRFTK